MPATPLSAGSSTRSTAPTTSCGACRSSGRSWPWSATASSRRASSPRRRLATAGGGWRGAERGPSQHRAARRRAGSPSRASASSPRRQVLYASAPRSRRPAWRPGSTASPRRPGASGASATSGATPSSPRAPRRRWSRWVLTPWDAAAPLLLVEEAGGRVDRLRRPTGSVDGRLLPRHEWPCSTTPYAHPCRREEAPAMNELPTTPRDRPPRGGRRRRSRDHRDHPAGPAPLHRALEPPRDPLDELERGLQPDGHVPVDAVSLDRRARAGRPGDALRLGLSVVRSGRPVGDPVPRSGDLVRLPRSTTRTSTGSRG